MATITLDWPANPAAEQVTEYQVFQGANGGALTLLATTPTNSHVITNPPANAVYRWAVKAVNFVGPGPLSAETQGPGLPSAPGTVVVSVS